MLAASAYSSASRSRSLNSALSRHPATARSLSLPPLRSDSFMLVISIQNSHKHSCAMRALTSERSTGSRGERLRSR